MRRGEEGFSLHICLRWEHFTFSYMIVLRGFGVGGDGERNLVVCGLFFPCRE